MSRQTLPPPLFLMGWETESWMAPETSLAPSGAWGAQSPWNIQVEAQEAPGRPAPQSLQAGPCWTCKVSWQTEGLMAGLVVEDGRPI